MRIFDELKKHIKDRAGNNAIFLNNCVNEVEAKLRDNIESKREAAHCGPVSNKESIAHDKGYVKACNDILKDL